MIQYITELNTIANFQAWSGGKDRLDRVIELDRIEELDTLIKELFCDRVPTETELNDFLWFDLETFDGWRNLWNDDDDEDQDNE